MREYHFTRDTFPSLGNIKQVSKNEFVFDLPSEAKTKYCINCLDSVLKLKFNVVKYTCWFCKRSNSPIHYLGTCGRWKNTEDKDKPIKVKKINAVVCAVN